MNQDTILSEKIEILSLELFKTHKFEMNLIDQFQKNFNADLGWHYYLDLAWIIREISRLPKGSLVLDAGGGSGILQFMLSDLGYNIISVDFMDRSFSSKYLQHYRHKIRFLNNPKKTFDNTYTRYLKSLEYREFGGYLTKLIHLFKRMNLKNNLMRLIDKKKSTKWDDYYKPFIKGNTPAECGNIFLYTCDLKNMPLLPECIFDGVVSVSALEHNDQDDFVKCIEEILRVTKPSGKLFITTSASQAEDWFHEPSKGWCYSEATIRKLFRLPENVQSNFSDKDFLFEKLMKEGNPLHQRLAPVYQLSGNNGMPWGKWDPQYQSVGVEKVKHT